MPFKNGGVRVPRMHSGPCQKGYVARLPDFHAYRAWEPVSRGIRSCGTPLQAELAALKPRPKPVTKTYADLRAAIVPPYDPRKFPNKWRKMDPDRPVRTSLAHIGRDAYSPIHYDASEARS